MNTALRVLLGLPGAVLITAVLFAVLAGLIRQTAEVRLSEDKSVSIHVTRQIEDTSVRSLVDLQRPVLDRPPPPPPAVHDSSFRPSITGQIGELPDFSKTELDIAIGFNPDRDAQPVVRIPPMYPDRCESRAQPVEYVVVQFDVTPEGAVVNPRVVNSSNSCFERAAMQSVSRWKYQPKVEGGQPKPRFGVQTQITFQLKG